MKQKLKFKEYIQEYLNEKKDFFKGKTVVDCPAGSGETSSILKGFGCKVIAMDLFPEYFKVEGLTCLRVNVMEGIPLESNSVDCVICQEGIEHFSDQMKVLKEFSRILKKNGTLIITTPNYSNMRARMSYFLSESERFNEIMSPNELDSIWMSDQNISKEIYFGHIFLIGIQKLRVLSKIAGFKISKIGFEQAKPTSILLLIIFYPLIYLSNWITYKKNMRKNDNFSHKIKKEVYGEIFRLNVNPKILVDGTLLVEFEKEHESSEVADLLQSKYKNFDMTT